MKLIISLIVGLGAGAPAIGIPFFWPLTAMPNTVMDEWANMVFLKPNGASFSATTYPKLAKVWTGLIIPDMRGEFLRVWDDGRGVDVGRGLLSWQDSDNKEHLHDDMHSYGGGGAGGTNGTMSGFAKKYCTSADGYKDRPESGWLQASSGLHTMPSGGKEARPRNIAFNFLVRAK
ncbi:phage tail protein [Citrobacter amalonaticus]|uniref:phage tail protein n=1 Tax=Citrobacter amalonaticus TaxID=35703 RepID=UPI0007336B16|nr:phage tail protein [Citrobacter amalonaticus]PNP33387.1 phage tail protein [Citrobacter amalonaticus]